MRRLIFVFALLILSIFFPSHTKAEVYFCGGTYLLYANGIRTERNSAQNSLDTLILRIQERDLDEAAISWSPAHSTLAYNWTAGSLADLLEAYEQKHFEKMDAFWDWYFNLDLAPEWFRLEVQELLRRFQESMSGAPDLGAQEQLYGKILNRGDRILTVAHSQGNLFSNFVFKEFLSQEKYKKRLRLVSVANPADHVEGNGPYLTLTSDGVINLLVAQVEKMGAYPPLPPNFTNQTPKPGFFDHGFVDKYLFGDGSGNQILEYISKAFEGLAKDDDAAEDKRNHIEKPCWAWWGRTQKAMKKRYQAQTQTRAKTQDPIQDREYCYRYCITADVGMDSFYCNSHCEYFCHCQLDHSR